MDKEPEEYQFTLEEIMAEFPPIPEPQTEEAPKPEPKPERESKPERKSKPEPEPEQKPKPEPESEQKPRPRRERKPKPRPEPSPQEEPTLRLVSRNGKLVEDRPKQKEKEDLSAQTRRVPTREPEAPSEDKEEKKLPWWKRKPQSVKDEDGVIHLPEEDRSVTARLGRLIERADDYADKMFPDDNEPDAAELERERLLPGVDYEDEPTHQPKARRRPRRVRRPKPDVPPGELAKKYKRKLAFLHTRVFLEVLLCLPQLYLMLAPAWGLPLPWGLEDLSLRCHVAALALALSALLGADVLGHGIAGLFTLRLERETLLLFAVAASLGDALTAPVFEGRGDTSPYCGVMAAAMAIALWGRFLKLRGLRQSCRVADSAAEPYLVTLEERAWNGADAYMKWSGDTEGYGSQIQEPDGAQRFYHAAAPLLLLAGLTLALLASVGQKRPELFFWCLSAVLTTGCGFACFLNYALPFSGITRRLGAVGAALGGWDSLGWSGRGQGAVLTDGDVFPPGSVTLNGIKLCGDLSMETAVSYTASLIRETGSAVEKPFRDMLRTQNGILRRCSQVLCHEGGVTGVINGRQIHVGSAPFMELMRIQLPPGLKVKNGVFCAVDGQLQAIFALNYRLHPAVRPSLKMLISNGLHPILATRDFLIVPEMLRQRFKLPVDRVEFPNLDRRRELSNPRQEHPKELAAVLCREGLGPYAEAVVGGKRLVTATRLGSWFSLLGSVLGMALSFYLTAAQAFTSLSAGAVLAFLLLWMVPGVLISGWATRY